MAKNSDRSRSNTMTSPVPADDYSDLVSGLSKSNAFAVEKLFDIAVLQVCCATHELFYL